MASIFLCHSSRDKFFVRKLAQQLKGEGVRVWIDEAELTVGDSLIDKIGGAITDVDYVGVVLSTNSISSTWVQKELQIALQREFAEGKVVVLPILLEPVEVPPFLRDKVYADFTAPENFESTFPKLLDALGVKNAKKKLAPPKQERPPKVNVMASERKLLEFEDIKIVDLDDERSYNPDEKKALYNMYLKLSRDPPAEWEQIFMSERQFPRHSMWRRAWIEGSHIVIYCVPNELVQFHMKDLLRDVKNSNEQYRQYFTEQAKKEVAERDFLRTERHKLRGIRKRLGFD